MVVPSFSPLRCGMALGGMALGILPSLFVESWGGPKGPMPREPPLEISPCLIKQKQVDFIILWNKAGDFLGVLGLNSLVAWICRCRDCLLNGTHVFGGTCHEQSSLGWSQWASLNLSMCWKFMSFNSWVPCLNQLQQLDMKQFPRDALNLWDHT